MVNERLDQLIDAVNVSQNERAIRTALLSFAKRCGFNWFAYMDSTFPLGAAFTNYPAAWQETYEMRKYAGVDPVLAQAKRLMRPFTWDSWPDKNCPEGIKNFWKAARDHGIEAGLSIPVRSPFGAVTILTFAASTRLSLTEPLDEFKATAAAAFVRARITICGSGVLTTPDIPLSARETECLLWASLGKSMATTAELLGLRECTVRFYLESARTKLGACNTVNAVYQAVRQQII